MADLTGAHFLPLPSTLRPDRPASIWLRRRIIAGIGLVAFAMVGCQSSSPGPGSIQVQASDRALPVMERVALAANRCWFKSGDGSFRAYRLAPELTSFTGRPRILLVPANKPEDRPLAVIEAKGDPATVQAYGPLLTAPLGNRIATDVRNWSGGSTSCAT